MLKISEIIIIMIIVVPLYCFLFAGINDKKKYPAVCLPDICLNSSCT